MDAAALTAPASINGKLSLRRTPPDQLAHQTQPRAVMRVANRGNTLRESLLQDLQNDVERLSRAFASLEANALVFSEPETQTSRIDDDPGINGLVDHTPIEENVNSQSENEQPAVEAQPLSRNARRRMRQRVRAALNATQPPDSTPPVPPPQAHAQTPAPRRQNGYVVNNLIQERQGPTLPPAVQPQTTNGPSTSTGPSQNGNQGRNNKKNRRQRR